MTNEDFVLALNNVQQNHFNTWMVSIRAEYQAQYETSAASLVAAKADDLKSLADQITTNNEAHAKALAELQKSNKDATDKLIEDYDKTIKDLQDAHTAATTKLVSDQANTAKTLKELEDSTSTEVAALQSKVTFLESIRTYDPNVIRSEAFYQRITGDERFQLGVLALTDDNAKGILSLLNAYMTEKWKVLLNDPQVVEAMQYLSAIGLLKEGRVAKITQPASRKEAYTDPIPE